MLDRLTVLFFLIPAIIVYFRSLDRPKMLNLMMGIGVCLFCTAAFYREFFMRHTEELFSQAPVGEIDSAGMLVQSENPIPFLYYLLSLIDTQAGPFIGIAMLIGVVLSLRKRIKGDGVLWSTFVPALLFFSFVAKKQSYYTLPILVPLAILAGRNTWTASIAIVGGLLGWLSLGIGYGNIGKPWLPERLVAPRYVLAKPPSFQEWPIDDLAQHLPATIAEMVVFSEDQTLYEGFLSLKLRKYSDGHVRGITADPIGVWEFLDVAEYFVWMSNSDKDWPTSGLIEAELISDHYDINELPVLPERFESIGSEFQKVDEWPSGEGRLLLFKRIEL